MANQFNCVPFPLWALPCCQTARGKGGQIPQCARLGVGATSYGNNFKNNNKLSLEKFFGFVFFFSTAHSFLDRMPNVLAWKGGYPLLLPGASFRFCSQIAPCCLCAHVCVHKCVCSPTDFLCPLLFFYQLPVLLLITLPAWGLRSARCFLQLKASQGTIFGGRNFWGPSKDS